MGSWFSIGKISMYWDPAVWLLNKLYAKASPMTNKKDLIIYLIQWIMNRHNLFAKLLITIY